MEAVITKELIERGLKANIIVPVLEENDTLKAKIGEYWFWFGGSEFESADPKDILLETLVSEIQSVLNDFRNSEYYVDEYLYYFYYISEQLMQLTLNVNER